jgi:hypothetical protein
LLKIVHGVTGEHDRILAEGDAMSLAVSVGRVVQSIYSSIRHHDPAQAAIFRVAMMAAMLDSSPVWQEPDDDSISIVVPHEQGGDADGGTV